MTREEAKHKYTEYIKVPSVDQRSKRVHNAIDEIYDYFKSRTCENCKYYDGSHKCNNENSIAHNSDNRVYPYDGCIEDFEVKK